ncbi:MAG: hypothetical protein IPM96_06280 [Ignavibacteria bacterium]|nr:hypothetical protein [Ignavibacteria bacterium]
MEEIQKKKALYYYFYSIGTGSIGISTFSPISKEKLKLLKRFRNVFVFAYRRYREVMQTEAQMREAKIELSLERVRARSMAMHSSDELVDASIVLFNELSSLGIDSIRTGVAIVDEKIKSVEIWSSQLVDDKRNKILGVVPFKTHVFFEQYYKAWKKKKPYFLNELKGNEVKEYYKKMASLLSYPLKKIFNPQEYFYTFFFPEGSLNVVSKNSLTADECNLLVRFAKVFGMIYTRFLDLQKAEAQAREAQIEVALERVRSRTMAMHKSEELAETAAVLFEQLCGLGMDALRLYIGIIDHKNDEIDFWTTDYGGSQISSKYKASLFGSATFRNIYSGWKEKRKSLVVDPKGKELTEHLYYLKEIMNYPIRDRKTLSRRLQTIAYFSNGLIGVLSTDELPKESVILLERFAGVFDLTYRRFLDLQKAEDQAREAQIETALERVRSRTMGMQKSEELGEVSRVMNEQLQQLNFKNYIAGFIMDYKNSNDFEIWRSDPSQLLMSKTHIPYFDHPIFKEFIRAKEKCLDFNTLSLTFEEKNKWVDYVLPYFPALPQGIIDALYSGAGYATSVAFMKNVGVYIENFDGIPFSEDENAILIRFGKVFEQTYTRFLDLQKAESQAREAQIEVALERVRSRTMAMHSSEELQDAAVLLFQQIKDLGVNTGSCGYIIWDKEKKDSTAWMSSAEGSIQEPFKLLHTKSKIYKEIYSAKESGKDFFVKEVRGAELKKHFDYLTTVPGIGEKIKQLRKSRYKFPETIVYNIAFFKHGYLSFHTHELTPEAHDIFRRFANVFEQTYTRFLDLQKAEAQVREAKIEASLEKIRSRSLAMHKAEELGEVITVVVEKLRELDFSVDDGVALITHTEGSKDLLEWMANPGFPSAIKFYLPYFEHPVLSNLWKAKNEGADFIATRYTAEENKSFLKHIFKHSDFKHTPQPIKDYCMAANTYATSIAFQKNTAIFINDYSGNTLTEQEIDILKRFSKVFEQTYIRFLDLQKAEAQAREAKIETALERVRSRTMGMQKSEELKDVIKVVYEQFVHLEIFIEHTGFVVDYKKRDDYDIWVADKIGDIAHVTIPYFDSIYYNSFNEAKEKGKDFFVTNLNFKEKNIFYKKLFKSIPGLDEEAKKFYFNCPGLAISTVLLDNVSLYIENFSGIPYSDEENKTLMRFGKVFQQTYTRFLDLQKAEAQAREAQIETALEKIRSQTMGMQTSEDLSKVAAAMFDQIRMLGGDLFSCGIVLCDENKNEVDQWLSAPDIGMMPPFFVPKNLDFIHQYRYDKWKAGVELFSIEIPEDKIAHHFELLFALPSLKNILDSIAAQGLSLPEVPKWEIDYGASFKFGYILISALQPFKEAHIFPRFAKVFEQTYTRFLDLQKAEAQARESQIEAALERVRGKAMAMHNSDDLTEAAGQVFTELNNLGIKPIRSGFVLLTKDSRKAKLYPATSFDNKNTISFTGEFEFTGHPVYEKQYEIWRKKENYFPVLEDDLLKSYYKILAKGLSIPYKNFPTDKKQFGTFLPFSEGFLFTWSSEPYSKSEINILERFKNILDLTIRRYLDLKNAEAQSRESQIEASLERVRSKAMAMQTSDDLSMAVSAIFEELEKLELGAMRCGIGIINKEKKSVDVWASAITDGQKIIELSGDESMDSHPLLKGAFDAWLRQEDFSYLLQDDDLLNYYEVMVGSSLEIPDSHLILQGDEKQKQFYHVSVFQAGGLFAFRETEFPEEAKIVMKRFADVINFTYTRFNDLTQAEAQAKEAKLEAALERVRAEALIMRKPEDMLDVCKVISEQLILLNVNEIRNTQTAILNEGKESYQNYEYFPDYNESTISEINYNLHPKVTEFVNEIKKSAMLFL